jgi:hypothetical protein
VFLRSAERLRTLLASAGIDMEIERDNACRGFEVFVDDIAVVSLLDMPRPFVKLRALDLERVAKDVSSLCASA